jgi:hypothetical protein
LGSDGTHTSERRSMKKTANGAGKKAPLPLMCLALLLVSVASSSGQPSLVRALKGTPFPHNYVFFNFDRNKISDSSFLKTNNFEGAQLKYTWKELEPEKDKFDFSAIDKDLEFLTQHKKKLFVQVQDATFDPKRVNVPDYLVKDKQYHGGYANQYDETEKKPVGTVARRWDPSVQERFLKLLAALGEKFDGKITGINLPETAIDFGESKKHYPPGFTPQAYREAIIENMKALRKAFHTSVTIQYANFMPGEFLPWDDHGYLKSVYSAAKEMGMGVGGPDLLPYKKSQMNNGYHMIKDASGTVMTGIAAQDGNYAFVNPNTHRRVTVDEMYKFARDYLGSGYIFWCTEEPYYTKNVLPYMNQPGRL